MAWESVEWAARFEARQLEWGGPDPDPPRLLERLVRRVFRLPLTHTVEDGVTSRLVMVVPTSGDHDVVGSPRTYGWAVRLLSDGTLEYLRWRAFSEPDWTGRFPFGEEQLEPFTAGSDHWGPLDSGQRLKTDLDWPPSQAVTVRTPDGRTSWSIAPRATDDSAETGSGMVRALSRLHQDEHAARPVAATALPHSQ